MRLNEPVSSAETPTRAQAAQPQKSAGQQVPLIDTAELFARSPEVRLMHAGCEYRLRVTRQGKLLLTK